MALDEDTLTSQLEGVKGMTAGEGEGTELAVGGTRDGVERLGGRAEKEAGGTGDGVEGLSGRAERETEGIDKLGRDGRELAGAGKGFEAGTGMLG